MGQYQPEPRRTFRYKRTIANCYQSGRGSALLGGGIGIMA